MMQHSRELECVRVHGHAYVRRYLRDRVHAVAVFMLRPVCLFLGPDIHTPNPNQYGRVWRTQVYCFAVAYRIVGND